MDPNELLQALQFSVGKTQEEIRMAEQFLTQAKTVNGYMPSLLLIACNKDAVIHVRQSAIVNLHTAVKNFWKRESLEQAGEVKPLEDMATLKENILEAMIKCADTPKIYKEMIEIIKHIANFDFPDKWPEILPSIIEKLKASNDFQEVYGGLLALMAIFKVFKSLFTETDRLQNIVDSTFGFLETFAGTLLGDSGLQAATALHVVLKVVTLANMWITPRYFLNEKNLETWMGYFKVILEKELPQELVSSTEDLRTTEQREKNVYWRIKRISSKIVTHFVTKFRKLPKEQKALSQVFSSNYSVGFFKIFMEILAKKKTNYIDTKLQFYAMRYIKKSFKDNNVKTLLQDHLEFYMFDVLVPSMYITMRNKEDWDENPIEFIRDEEDLMMRPNNLKTIAYRTLKKITSPDFTIAKKQVGGLVLVKFMKHAGQALSTGKDPRTDQPVDIRMKEAILHIIGVLKRAISETDEISEQMELLLEKFVIPEFSNEVGFIRFRACWLFGIFGDLDFKGETIVQTATEGLYKCILDNKLPVKVQAGLALDRVSGHKIAHNILKPGLNKIFEIYLNLISVIDNEGLVSALEGVITKFGDDIHPYALDLIRNLTTVYAKQATGEGAEEDEDADDDDMDEGALDIQEKQAAASMCLSAISKILSCNLSQQTILEAQEILLPLLRFTILDERTDDIEAGLGLLNVLLYNLETIPEKLWLYFLEIIYMITGKPESAVHPNFASLSEDEKFLLRHQITGWGSDYISEMVPCLQNYVQKGKNVIFTERDQYYNLTYVELIFKWIDRIYEICYNGTYDLDMALASQLYITIVENYPKQIDELLPYILDKTLFNFNRSRSNMMRKVLVQIIALCLWYDPRSTLLYIESKGATEVIFKKWMQLLPKFKLDYECERAMIGLSSIFRINVNDLPPIVLSSLPELIKQLIELSSKIIVLREEEEDEDEDGDDFDDDDDSDEDETEDNFDEIMAKVNKANSGKSPFVDADSFNPKDYLGLSDEVLDKNDMMNDVQDFKALEWLHSQAEYDSPFDGKCEIGYFQEGLEMMQRDQPDAYNQLVGCLSNEEKTTLQGNFEKAHQQALEFQELMKKTA